MTLINDSGELVYDSYEYLPLNNDIKDIDLKEYVTSRMVHILFDHVYHEVDVDPKIYFSLLKKVKRKFYNLKDSHFPNGYDSKIQESINERVVYFLSNVARYYPLNEIKTILDIGSLNGIESVKFVEKLDNVKVYNFEPNPESYQNILKSINGIENIFPKNFAISNFNGFSQFHVSKQNVGGSSLLKPKMDYNAWSILGDEFETINVPVLKLSDWCNSENIENVDLMWIDVQGNELNVFEGMGEVLNTVKGIFVECSLQNYYEGGVNVNVVEEFLKKYGFEMVGGFNLAPPIDAPRIMPTTLTESAVEGDFIFIKKNEKKI